MSSVAESIEEAAGYPQASPWYRAVYAGDEPVGFVMLSWDCVPQPPEIIGPWFLWKLIIDERHQHRGYGRDVVQLVADLVREQGAHELFVSYATEGEGGPGTLLRAARLRADSGEVDVSGEIMLPASTSAAPRSIGGEP